MSQRLSPGSILDLDRPLSIETMRAMMEAAPTYPEAWTLDEGTDYVCAYLALSH